MCGFFSKLQERAPQHPPLPDTEKEHLFQLCFLGEDILSSGQTPQTWEHRDKWTYFYKVSWIHLLQGDLQVHDDVTSSGNIPVLLARVSSKHEAKVPKEAGVKHID